MNGKIYRESQSFTTWWLVLLFLGLIAMEGYDSYRYFIEQGSWHFSSGIYIILILAVAMFVMRLHTTIDEDGVEITFIPFAYKKRWLWDEIGESYLRTYGLMDFGGWGYRLSSEGKAYNTKGKHGLQLVLKNGSRIMIGTQKPEEIEQFLKKLGMNLVSH